ncbi:MAG: malate synthase G, partial [Pontixanthobacter sp.]
MNDTADRAGLQIDRKLAEFLESEVLTPLGRDVGKFWTDFAVLLARFSPRNRHLLEKRESIQAQIDSWHRQHRGQPHDPAAYRTFLEEIGYLVPEPGDFTIGT